MPDTSQGVAELKFNYLTEQGRISMGGIECAVVKHGPLSGHWTLETAGQIVADARKPSAFVRSFELHAQHIQITVRALSPLTRAYGFYLAGNQIGVIRPANPFTRRAFIDCPPEVPEAVQLFAFWLVVITWRRQARSNENVKIG